MIHFIKKTLFLLITYILFQTQLTASTLNLAMTSSPSRLNPILSNDSASSEISQWLFNGLFKYDKNGKIVNDLASGYKFHSKTKLVIKLRKDVFWHDGEKFTSKDVLFTYNSIINPKIFVSFISNYQKVKSVRAIDDYTLEVIYSKPYFKALEVWLVGILPHHIYKDEKDMMTSKFNKTPIGTGSYKLSSFKTGKDIKLVANENYFEGKPKINEIHYSLILDPSTSFLMLKKNKLDIGSLTALQIDRQINAQFKKDYQIIEQPSKGYNYLGFNLRLKKFQDIKVRRALSLAINRQELIDILYFGHAKICHGPFLRGGFAFNKNVLSPKQDINKALKLLKDAGYDENNPLEFEVVTSTGSQTGINTVQILQHQLKKVNVNLKIAVMEWQAFLNTKVLARNFDAVVLGWNLALMPDAYSIWHSKSDKKGGFNFIGYKNNTVDKLIEKGALTVDKEKLGIIYKQLFKLISEDVPYLFLIVPNTVQAVNGDIKNIKPAFTGIMHNQKIG